MKTARILGAATALALAATGLLAGSVGPSSADVPDGSHMAPVDVLLGSETGLNAPAGIAFDDNGLMYVANMLDKSITVYDPDDLGVNRPPLKTLKGNQTMLIMPVAIAFDDEQRMYVVNSSSVTVYEADWADGNTAPVKTLMGTSTRLLTPRGIAFDSTGRMYITNSYDIARVRSGSVTVYAADWPSGDTAPVATLTGMNTGLSRPTGIQFDEDGFMYVVDGYGVGVYEPGWDSGDTEPVKTLAGPGSGIADPRDLVLSDDGYMYVANSGRSLVGEPHISVYPQDWSGEAVTPAGLIFGESTLLDDPYGIAYREDGRLYVTNQGSNLITVFQTQTLEFAEVTDVPWTTNTVTVSATSESALPVTIVTTSPEVCQGRGTSPLTVTILEMGACTFDAYQLGGDGWLPAPSITGSFQVTTAPQTITVSGPASASLAKKWTRVKASTTSGLPVVWTSQTPDVCLHKRSFGQRVQLKATGTCTMSAYQRGNSLWDSAGPETVNFEVTP